MSLALRQRPMCVARMTSAGRRVLSNLRNYLRHVEGCAICDANRGTMEQCPEGLRLNGAYDQASEVWICVACRAVEEIGVGECMDHGRTQ